MNVVERLTVGAIPRPESKTTYVSPSAFMEIAEFRIPLRVGVNLTLNVQNEPTGSDGEQSLVLVKSPAVIVMLEIARLAIPVLVRVTVATALAIPTR